MLSFSNHITNRNSPEQHSSSRTGSLFLSIVTLFTEAVVCEIFTHWLCDQGSYKCGLREMWGILQPFHYLLNHAKLFIVCVKQNKTKHFSVVKRLHFGNDSLLLFPTITRVCVSLMIPGRAGEEICASLSPISTSMVTFLSELLLLRLLKQWNKGGAAIHQTMLENWRVAHKRLHGNYMHILYTANSKWIMGQNHKTIKCRRFLHNIRLSDSS